jgi:hypothetical protein
MILLEKRRIFLALEDRLNLNKVIMGGAYLLSVYFKFINLKNNRNNCISNNIS